MPIVGDMQGYSCWTAARFGNAEIKLGACGDWLLGPRVEAAWLSGHRLAMQIGDC